MKTACLTLLLYNTGAPAIADPEPFIWVANVRGTELLQWCTSDKVGFQGMCLGFVSGVASAADLTLHLREVQKDVRCLFYIPAGTNMEQLKVAVTSRLKEYPMDLHQLAVQLTMRYLAEEFPCMK